jgi:hypothetical protein
MIAKIIYIHVTHTIYNARFEVLTAMFPNFEVFWNVTARQIIKRNHRSVVCICLHLQVEAIREKRNAFFWVVTQQVVVISLILNPLNAELNPICHLLALLGTHHILHVSRIRVKDGTDRLSRNVANELLLLPPLTTQKNAVCIYFAAEE